MKAVAIHARRRHPVRLQRNVRLHRQRPSRRVALTTWMTIYRFST
jgi:hypothetical protein